MVWAAVILAALLLLLRQNLEVRVLYRGQGGHQGLEVTVSAFGGRALYQSAHPVKAATRGAAGAVTGAAESWFDVPHALRRWAEQITRAEAAVSDYQVVVDYLRRRVVARRIAAEVTVGTGEVFWTGVATGAAWATLGIIGSRLRRIVPVGPAQPAFKVVPSYERRAFEASLDCIFTVRTGHIIGAVVRVWQAGRRRRLTRVRSG
ncbi:MAG TPA: DUF2953 domain-containing protein [Bacillota bacterium]